jgi:hypothetical protein
METHGEIGEALLRLSASFFERRGLEVIKRDADCCDCSSSLSVFLPERLFAALTHGIACHKEYVNTGVGSSQQIFMDFGVRSVFERLALVANSARAL